MGRPPGAKNGTGSQGGAKNSTKPAAGSGGGKGAGKTSSGSTAVGGGEKDKSTLDRSQSNFPYDIRLNSYASLHNAVTKGTPRIKRILTEECDYIMECRVCRNLFRSLPNLITHKLNYCKKAFDSTWCIGLSNLIQSGDSSSVPSFNVEYEVDPELVLINAPVHLSSSNESDNLCSEPIPSQTRTRSVADYYNELAEMTRVEKSQQSQPTSVASSPTSSTSTNNDNKSSNVVRLKLKPLKIPGADSDCNNCSVVSGGGMKSIVVEQQIVSNDPSNCDNTCTKPVEFLRKDTAILGPDGKVLCTAPGKGIEQVVSRLTAQLKALEEKEAQKMAAAAKSTIICDICKTVFDSDKALRQHKRESLDCGKTWGFKSPNHEKSSPMKTNSSEDTLMPTKRAKLPSDEDTGTNSDESENAAENDCMAAPEAAQSVRLSRFISPPKKGRRPSHHHSLNSALANKSKRSLSLSPVKKIKMKYIKLDSALSSSSREIERRRGCPCSYSCNRCSASFTTKHEMSMHLALCTGVINYAYLKESEPPQEKIRISLRNDFPKASTSVPTPQASPSFNSTTISESHHLAIISRQRHMSGASSSRGATPTAEVNNNKQYKNSYQQHVLSGIGISAALSSSEEEDASAVVPAALEYRQRLGEEEGDSDITSHDSGVSSASSTKKKSKPLATGGATKKVKILKTSSSPASKSAKVGSAGSGGGGTVSERLESKKTAVQKVKASTTKVKQQKQQSSAAATVNLRKTIQSRIRKSRRVLKPPPPPQKQHSSN